MWSNHKNVRREIYIYNRDILAQRLNGIFWESVAVEGWVVLVRGLHEETREEDVYDKFGEYGEVKNLHLNLDRKTGFVKGYALLEFGQYKEAKAAVAGADGTSLLGKTLTVCFNFVQEADDEAERANGQSGRTRRNTSRSASPTRRVDSRRL